MANLNVQGLSRRDKGLMSCIVADPGNIIVSSDIGAAEPSITAHYSRDPNYRLATFDMIGKKPYYDDNDMLIIDDIYLMVASKYPAWGGPIRKAYNDTYDGKTFAEKWLEDPDYLAKKVLGAVRGPAKALCLGIGYGLGPKNMVLYAAQNGFELPLKEAKAFFKHYWKTYARVKRLGSILEARFEKQGFLQNEFGFCLYPDAGYKCLNYWIQSSVTGLMNLFQAIFFNACEDAIFVTIIHDELLFEVPKDKIPQVKSIFNESVKELNRILNWSIPIRFGWVEGANWYEAK